MYRTVLCTALVAIAMTAAQAEAGKFKFKFGGGHNNHGNHGGHNHHNNNHKYHGFWHNNHHNHHHHNHHVKVYRAPVVKCYYQVCFYADHWTYKQHKTFSTLHAAEVFAHDLKHAGYHVSISKSCHAHYTGPQLLVPKHLDIHHAWMP